MRYLPSVYARDLSLLPRCLQHPYLVNEGIEPKDLAPTEVHEKLVSASAKLILLRTMLPKLRERGHRVLLFSQVGFPRTGTDWSLTMNVVQTCS